MFLVHERYRQTAPACSAVCYSLSHQNHPTVLYKLDGTKRNTNPKTNPNLNTYPNTNSDPKLTQILTLFSCFMLFFQYHPLYFSLAVS